MLRLLIDESLPRSLGTALSATMDVVDGRDVGLSGKGDPDVFAYAQRDARVLVCADVDFADIVAYPLGTHAGIVVVRLPSKRVRATIVDVVLRALVGQDADMLRGCLVVVDERRVRTRRPAER